jgi:hypothetical protein
MTGSNTGQLTLLLRMITLLNIGRDVSGCYFDRMSFMQSIEQSYGL